jgi:hypothetical protein
MDRSRRIETAGLALIVAVFLMTPAAGAQHAGMGGTMSAAPVHAAAPARALRAPAGSVVVRSGGIHATTSVHHTRGATAPDGPSRADLLSTGTPDPYINSGGVPLYIDGVLNAGPGSVYYGNNNLLGVKAFIDPATQLQLAAYNRFRRGLQFSGIFLPLLPMYADVPAADEEDAEAPPPPDQGQTAQSQQPQVIIVREAPENATENTQPPPNAAPEEQTEPPDEGAFLLIFRDGSSEQAAAFTRSGDQVIFITPDGMRQTVPLSELDLDATQRVNQERGTPLQLSSN